jgi:preprotein translocase subunit YajC
MADLRILVALAGPTQNDTLSPALVQMMPVLLIFAIFYFILIMPMKSRQKKLEDLQKGLKSGDQIILNPGIFAQVVGVEEDALVVRIAEQTKIRVLRSAVAGLQGQPIETEKK